MFHDAARRGLFNVQNAVQPSVQALQPGWLQEVACRDFVEHDVATADVTSFGVRVQQLGTMVNASGF